VFCLHRVCCSVTGEPRWAVVYPAHPFPFFGIPNTGYAAGVADWNATSDKAPLEALLPIPGADRGRFSPLPAAEGSLRFLRSRIFAGLLKIPGLFPGAISLKAHFGFRASALIQRLESNDESQKDRFVREFVILFALKPPAAAARVVRLTHFRRSA